MSFQDKLLENPDRLKDFKVHLTVELASKEILIQDLLDLEEDKVIVFDEDLDKPLFLKIKNKRVAEGLLVKAQDGYGIKITKILDTLET